MGGQLADLIVTDPPYGMSYGGGRAAGSSPKGARVKAHGMIKNDDAQADDLVGNLVDAAQCAVAASKPGAAAYVCFTWRTYAEFESALNGAGLKVANCIVWDKRSIGLGTRTTGRNMSLCSTARATTGAAVKPSLTSGRCPGVPPASTSTRRKSRSSCWSAR